MIEFLADMWDEGFVGKVLALFLVAAVLMLAFVVYVVIDNESNRIESGVVVEKHNTPARYQIVMVGKVPVNQYFPERWSLTITDGVKTYTASVSEELYEEAKNGDTVNLKTQEVRK